MGKGRSRGARKGSTPKGLPVRRGGGGAVAAAGVNPFEHRSVHGRAKHAVVNRLTPSQSKAVRPRCFALERSLRRRAEATATTSTGQASLVRSQKDTNRFVDGRIDGRTEEERTVRRIVGERTHRYNKTNSRRQQRSELFHLGDHGDGDDEEEVVLTHKGRTVDEVNGVNNTYLDDASDDDDDDDGRLDRADTEMHFGGGKLSTKTNTYGGGDRRSLADVYANATSPSPLNSKAERLRKHKMEKAEKRNLKEHQADTFAEMDSNFLELARLLNFRTPGPNHSANEQIDKVGAASPNVVDGDDTKGPTMTAKETDKSVTAPKVEAKTTQMDREMDEWERERKSYQFERRVAATDRTKSSEEIAREEAERLHELETRRLARMEGDFADDDLSDVSDDDDFARKRKRRRLNSSKKKKKEEDRNRRKGDDELDDEAGSEENEDKKDEREMRFTPEGIVYVDKKGRAVPDPTEDPENEIQPGNKGTSDDDSDTPSESSSDEDDDDDDDDDSSSSSASEISSSSLRVGMKVEANYHAAEQFENREAWYPGRIRKVHSSGTTKTYDIDYDDGDFEEKVTRDNLKTLKLQPSEDANEEDEEKDKESSEQRKRRKAQIRARESMPYVLEVPSTLDAFNELVGEYCAVGSDVTVLVDRIYKSNRVGADSDQKLTTFATVLLRRFVAVGDRLFTEHEDEDSRTVGRYAQLESLTKVLYQMARDAPGVAGSWVQWFEMHTASVFSVSGKRLPSLGECLLYKCALHVFPTTDFRHRVVTPLLLTLGRSLSQGSVRTWEDLKRCLVLASLQIECTRQARRVPAEALGFLTGVLQWFASSSSSTTTNERDDVDHPVLAQARGLGIPRDVLTSMLSIHPHDSAEILPKLGLLESPPSSSSTHLAVSILVAAIRLTRICADLIKDAFTNVGGRPEALVDLTRSLSRLRRVLSNVKADSSSVEKESSTWKSLIDLINSTLQSEGMAMKPSEILRRPLKLREVETASSLKVVHTVAPRLEERMSSLKNSTRSEADRVRRELKRETAAAARELKLDAAFVEQERRSTKEKVDSTARAKRWKNYAFMEKQQAELHRQVRAGGGLLQGGGTGAAVRAASSQKLGIKKGAGNRFR